jgi:hypothetical protein
MVVENWFHSWQASLRNVNSLDTPTVESGLLKLVPFLVNLLGQNLDLQPQALTLMDSYILLDGTRLMHVRVMGGFDMERLTDIRLR